MYRSEGFRSSQPRRAAGGGASRAFSVAGYGLDQWYKLFTPRQLVALGILIGQLVEPRTSAYYKDAVWDEAVRAYLTAGVSRLIDFCSTGVQWKADVPTVNHFFVRFALPITWDYAEANVLWGGAGSYIQCLDRVMTPFEDQAFWRGMTIAPSILHQSVLAGELGQVDVIVTDPPYYDAIPYSDVMDYFYVWLRRSLFGLIASSTKPFGNRLARSGSARRTMAN